MSRKTSDHKKGKKVLVFVCCECEKEFSRVEVFQSHFYNHHQGLPYASCYPKQVMKLVSSITCITYEKPILV